MAVGASLEMRIPSVVKLVDVVHATSEKMAEYAGFGEDDALNIGLAMREAVVNAIVHGNEQDPSKSVQVSITAKSDELVLRVADEGTGFNPEATPDPTEEDNLLNTSGRGLLLIRAFVDEVEFAPTDAGGTEIILRKRTSEKVESTG